MERDGFKFNLPSSDPKSYVEIAEKVAKLMKDKKKLNEIRSNIVKSSTIIDWEEVGKRWLECMSLKQQNDVVLEKN